METIGTGKITAWNKAKKPFFQSPILYSALMEAYVARLCTLKAFGARPSLQSVAAANKAHVRGNHRHLAMDRDAFGNPESPIPLD